MEKLLITQNMTMFDVAIQATGTVESIWEILAANGKGITEIPHAGDVYVIPDGIAKDQQVLDYLNRNNIILGTGNDPTLYIGIGYWEVSVDFKVS